MGSQGQEDATHKSRRACNSEQMEWLKSDIWLLVSALCLIGIYMRLAFRSTALALLAPLRQSREALRLELGALGAVLGLELDDALLAPLEARVGGGGGARHVPVYTFANIFAPSPAACALAAVVAFAHPATHPAASATIEANAQVFSITKCATCRFEAGQTLMVETFSCSSCAGEEKFGKMWSDVSLGGDCSCSSDARDAAALMAALGHEAGSQQGTPKSSRVYGGAADDGMPNGRGGNGGADS